MTHVYTYDRIHSCTFVRTRVTAYELRVHRPSRDALHEQQTAHIHIYTRIHSYACVHTHVMFKRMCTCTCDCMRTTRLSPLARLANEQQTVLACCEE